MPNEHHCPACPHPPHGGHVCNAPITETYRDDVGIFARPSGITWAEIVDECDCNA